MADTHTESNVARTYVVAGATGNLGLLITKNLIAAGATVKALVRKDSKHEKLSQLAATGATIVQADYTSIGDLTDACRGGACVISALSGLREVIVDAQTKLLEAAIAAGVPRFIPSDYCIDYTRLPGGNNRNLDLRREFAARVNAAPIQATSVLNGMFADLLTGEAPVVIFGLKRVVYWGDKNQLLDFTTTADTAQYTAAAAMDPSTPRYLCIAGETASASDLARIASEATGKHFKTFRAGSVSRLETFIRITKTLFPQPGEVFPAWQGMQYMRDMFTGLPKLRSLDNNRYPSIRWTPLVEVLTKR